MRVKVKKIGVSKNPAYPTPDAKDFVAGKENEGVSLPVEYWIEGELNSVPQIGTGIVVARDIRNGVKASGIFHSSPIVKIEGNRVETENSVYEVEFLNGKENKKENNNE